MLTRLAFIRRLRHATQALWGRLGVNSKLLLGSVGLLVCLSLLTYVAEMDDPAGNREYYGSPGMVIYSLLILVFSGFDIGMPGTALGRLGAIATLMVGVLLITTITADLASRAISHILDMQKRGVRRVAFGGHIVICNWSSRGKRVVRRFLDQADSGTQIVVVAHSMEPEMVHHPQVHFVSGDPTDEDVLSRAGIERAAAAAILSRSDIASSSSADAYSILVAMTVKHRNPDAFTCCEIRNPRNAKHLRLANVDEVVCSVEMGDAVMVQAALNPGLTQLLAQVLHSGDGAAIHRVKPRPEHEGLTVAELLPRLYLEHGCVLVGIDHPDRGGAAHVTTSLRPGDVIEAGHHLFVLSDGIPEGFQR